MKTVVFTRERKRGKKRTEQRIKKIFTISNLQGKYKQMHIYREKETKENPCKDIIEQSYLFFNRNRHSGFLKRMSLDGFDRQQQNK